MAEYPQIVAGWEFATSQWPLKPGEHGLHTNGLPSKWVRPVGKAEWEAVPNWTNQKLRAYFEAHGKWPMA